MITYLRLSVYLLVAATFLHAAAANANASPGGDSVQLLAFIEANRGQADSGYSHVARASGYTALLRADEALFLLSARAADGDVDHAAARRTTRVKMRLLDARADARPVASESLAGHSNYLRGRDPGQWVRQVPHFGKVVYADVYPGIDLVYTLQDAALRYDFVIAPQANAENIRLGFVGANRVRLGTTGDLHVGTNLAELVHSAPRIYQEVDGGQRDIAGGFAMQEDGTLRFRVAAHDPNSVLVIDPQVAFSTYLGGSGSDHGQAIVVDSSGRLHVAGQTASVDFPTVNPLTSVLTGDADIFVARFAADGQSLEYATYIGGSGEDNPHQIKLDTSGNVLLAGYTTSADYPLMNAAQTGFLGGGLFDSDGFVTKLAAAGDSLVFSTYLGGLTLPEPLFGVEWVRGLAVDGAENVYVVGETSGTDFPATQDLNGRGCMEGESGLASALIGDAFVAKYAADGTLIFAVCIGGAERDTGRGIALAADGSIVIVGFTRSSDYPVTAGAFQTSLASPGIYDAHVTRLNATGTGILSATLVGGSSFEFVQQVRIAADGSSVVVGQSDSDDFPTTTGALQTVKASAPFVPDATVFRLAPDASRLMFSTFLGGRGADTGWGLELDAAGLIYVSGYTSSLDLPLRDATQTAKGAAASIGGDVGPPADNTLGLAAGQMLRGGNVRTVLVAANEGVNRLYELDDAGEVAATVDFGLASESTHDVGLFDADRDGLADAVVAGNHGVPGSVYFTDGAGGFQAPVGLSGGGQLTEAVVVEPLNGSPEADLVLGIHMAPNLFYQGSPTGFGAGVAAFPGSDTTATRDLAVGDVNGDGTPDVVEANYMQANLLYLGTGTGFMAGSPIGAETDATMAVALGDFDGDTDLDLIVGNKGLGAPNRLYRNMGGGVFAAPEDLDPEAATTTSLLLRDVDFDGTLDVLASNEGVGWAYINDEGTGQFKRLPLKSVPEAVVALAGDPANSYVHAAKPIGTPIKRLNVDLNDAYLAVLDPAGRQLLFSTYLGGAGGEFSEWGLDVDGTGDAYVTGFTAAGDFPTAAAYQPNSAGSGDAFVTKFTLGLVPPTPAITYQTTLDLTAPSIDGITTVVFDWSVQSCGVSAADQFYAYSLTLFAGATQVYNDSIIADGILQPLGSETRDYPFWDFDLSTLTLNQFNTGADAVIGNPGATGVNYTVSDGLSLPIDGIVNITKYDGGTFIAADGPMLAVQSTAILASDCDADGVDDSVDNCSAVANADQRDTNGDGFGNLCDPDLNDDNFVDFLDLGQMKQNFFSMSHPDSDFNGDGITDFLDLGLMKAFFFMAPGPSGVAP